MSFRKAVNTKHTGQPQQRDAKRESRKERKKRERKERLEMLNYRYDDIAFAGFHR